MQNRHATNQLMYKMLHNSQQCTTLNRAVNKSPISDSVYAFSTDDMNDDDSLQSSVTSVSEHNTNNYYLNLTNDICH